MSLFSMKKFKSSRSYESNLSSRVSSMKAKLNSSPTGVAAGEASVTDVKMQRMVETNANFIILITSRNAKTKKR